MTWTTGRRRPGKWAEYVVCIAAGSNCTIADRGRSYTEAERRDAFARRDELRAGGAAALVCRLVPTQEDS